MPFAALWMDLEIIILNEVSQKEKDKYHMIPCIRQPTPVFLPEESHGEWSLAGYSPWGSKESDMPEAT